ncbi:NfeD family protein [Rothia halotolerans]|uniref:NfeD family protein n=1 Tax=Rothia halotolerans TaxID=405770 RepID=UPI00101BB1E4|nr:NfeD family protein [Rothia halotolerans]
MIMWFLANPWAIWLIVVLLLALIEMFSLEFFCLMMAGGAVVAAVTSYFTGNWIIQVLAFAVASLLLIILVRPSLMRRLTPDLPGTRNNVEALIGRPVQVLETVTELQGLVRLEGDTWSARLRDGAPLQPGAFGRVVEIDGATAVVEPEPVSGEAPAP